MIHITWAILKQPVDEVLNQRLPRKVTKAVVTQRWLNKTDMPEEKRKSGSIAYADNKKKLEKHTPKIN